MSKTKKLSKVLALILMLALVIGILPMGAMATNVDRTSRDFYNGNTLVSTATVTTTGAIVAGISDWSVSSPTEASFVVSLSPNCSLTSVNVEVDPVIGTSDNATIAINGTAVIHAGDIYYTVTVQKEDPYTAPTVTGTNAYIGKIDGEGVIFASAGTQVISGHSTYKFTAQAAATSYPYPVSLRIIPGGTSYDSTDYSITVTSNANDATLGNFVGTFYVAGFAASGNNLDFYITIGGVDTYYRITFTTTGGTPGSATNAYAYLPAPGQYTNEGMGTGGWGDVYTSAGELKNFSGSAPLTTGVSLGAFGGYLVYDFGTGGLDNSPNNPYGIDFIINGNAFWDNSEPGCVQVGVLNQNGTIAWYNIAGSLYYTDKSYDYDVTYGNPNPLDFHPGTLASVPYTVDDWQSNNLVIKNNFHNHSWFPLYENYFDNDRTISGHAAPSIAKTTTMSFADYQTNQDFHYNDGTSTGTSVCVPGSQTLELTGICLDTTVSKTKTKNYLFGYADVHPNGSGTRDVAYNPYVLNENTTSSAFNSLITNCNGGDPIDISWAVDGSGNPFYLTNIQYVRIYTGTQQMNGAFGEISTEVCGVYKVASAATSVGTTDAPSVSMTFTKVSDSTTRTISPSLPTTSGSTLSYCATMRTNATLCATTVYDITITAASGDNVFVNGVKLTETATPGVFSGTNLPVPAVGQKIQILVQSGVKAPYIVVLT